MVSKYRKTERDNHILGSLPPPPFRRPPFVPWETPPVISVRTFISQNGSCSAKLPVYCLFHILSIWQVSASRFPIRKRRDLKLLKIWKCQKFRTF